MPIGTVKFFNESKGYGFIQPDEGGNDAFVHITAVERAGMRSLRENQRIGYELEQDRRGKMSAVNLRSAEENAAPSDSGESAESAESADNAEGSE
jgi:CspA family cold shock protein